MKYTRLIYVIIKLWKYQMYDYTNLSTNEFNYLRIKDVSMQNIKYIRK